MYILIVEDDYLQADWITKELRKAFHNSEIDWISTEFDFRSRIESIAKRPPDIIVMDIMLPWIAPSEDMKFPPADVQAEGFYRAGLRCEKLLTEREETKKTPVILYSVLERDDLKLEIPTLPPNVHHMSKESNPGSLIDKIKQLTQTKN